MLGLRSLGDRKLKLTNTKLGSDDCLESKMAALHPSHDCLKLELLRHGSGLGKENSSET